MKSTENTVCPGCEMRLSIFADLASYRHYRCRCAVCNRNRSPTSHTLPNPSKKIPAGAAGLCLLIAGVSTIIPATLAADALYETEMVFDPASGTHGHVHASCITQYPNGDLLVVWYENGDELSADYFSKDKDKSDNVRTGAARRRSGETHFDPPFVIADTFGLADNNPCVMIDRDQQLWLIRPTLLGVPDWSWGSALVRYQVSRDFMDQEQPVWKKQDIFVPHIPDLKPQLDSLMDEMLKKAPASPRLAMYRTELEDRMKNQPLIARLGWMPRAHPMVRADGAVRTPPTKVQTFAILLSVEKKGEVDSIGNSDLIGFNFNVIDSGAKDFTARVPVSCVKSTFDLRRE